MRGCGAECVAAVGTFAVCEPADRSRTDGRLLVVVCTRLRSRPRPSGRGGGAAAATAEAAVAMVGDRVARVFYGRGFGQLADVSRAAASFL